MRLVLSLRHHKGKLADCIYKQMEGLTLLLDNKQFSLV